MAALSSPPSPFPSSTSLFNSWHQKHSPSTGLLLFKGAKVVYPHDQHFSRRKLRVVAEAQEDDDNPSVPSWAKPGSDEVPPWARSEAQTVESPDAELPFYVYLLTSAAIAAIGSIFQYANQRPVFGVLDSDSVFYAPLLEFFVLAFHVLAACGSLESESHWGMPGTPREFEFKDLKKSTNNFDEGNKLGQGEYGVVYRGVLVEEMNREIAVKCFSRENIKGQR